MLKLFLQILIFVELKIKELFWNTVTGFIYCIVLFVFLIIGVIIGIGAIAYNFVDFTTWGEHVYVLTNNSTFLNYLEVYSNLGGSILTVGIFLILFLYLIGALFRGLFLLIKGIFSGKVKRFFVDNWKEAGIITRRIIK